MRQKLMDIHDKAVGRRAAGLVQAPGGNIVRGAGPRFLAAEFLADRARRVEDSVGRMLERASSSSVTRPSSIGMDGPDAG